MEDTNKDNNFDVESAFNFIKEKDGRDIPFVWKLVHGKLEESDYEYECDQVELPYDITTIFVIPSNLHIKRKDDSKNKEELLIISECNSLIEIQDNVCIEGGDVLIEYCESLTKIGKNFEVDGGLALEYNYGLEKIGDGLLVTGSMTVRGGGSLTQFPKNMRIGDQLYLSGFELESIPYGLKVGGDLVMTHSFSIKEIRQTKNIKGLSDDAIEKLEQYIRSLIEQRGGSVGGDVIISI